MTPLDRLAADAAAVVRCRPGATYRLQMHAGFTLRDALARLDYFHAFGVTHLYLSPIYAAKPGSTHGYDVTDHGRLNPELGTPDDLAALVAGVKARGMGLLLDTVPNHMSVGEANPWWLDVLEHGRASRYAAHFDIAWDEPPRELLRGRVLLPVLGQTYAKAVADGAIRVTYDGGAFHLRVYDNPLPVAPRSYALLLAPVVDAMAVDDPAAGELRSILTAVRNLPDRDDIERAEERRDETVAIKRRLAAMVGQHPAVGEALTAQAAAASASVPDLDRIVEAQAYRPCYWRVASDEINYRRFFDVNDLAAVATEREAVFADVHRLTFQWLADGVADGLRIDHVDGLFDPKQYLDRLQSGYLLARAEKLLADTPDAFPGLTWAEVKVQLAERFATATDRPLYVVVEKILGPREELRADWATDGTTGYEFAVAVGGLFVDRAHEAELTVAYRLFADRYDTFAETAYRCKFLVLQSSLTSELHVLAGHIDRLAQAGRSTRDFTLNGLRHALREVLACFPAYRSYIAHGVTDADKRLVVRAVRDAHRRNPSLGREIFDFIRDSLLLVDPPDGSGTEGYHADQERFAGKFQQLTAPVTAKGVEDTALYRDVRLTALNEVGGHPGRYGIPPADVHAFLNARKPGELNPLSTHDTKRSEDVRARVAVLSELAEEYGGRVRRWAELNRRHKVDVDGDAAPDGNEEWLIYQTLLGAWPPEGPGPEFVGRVQAYMGKVVSEAKVNSSWLNPNAAYADAVGTFVERILSRDTGAEFLADFEPFQRAVADYGMTNSLAQTLVRCTAPGVPDTYQGTELWDLSLVDPDNRRPVDYDRRASALAALDAMAEVEELVASRHDDHIKLFVVCRAQRLRKRWPDLFADGEYVPVAVSGAKEECAFAYLRTLDGRAVLTAVPRLVTRLGPPGTPPDWGDTRLQLPEQWADRTWTDAFTGTTIAGQGGVLKLGEALTAFPVACLAAG